MATPSVGRPWSTANVTLFANRPDQITRDRLHVMHASCADELSEIQKLWPWFEERVGLRGRKMYAAADVRAGTYTTCTPVRPEDDPELLGLETGELPGGIFRRGRLRGTPPEVYGLIGPGFDELQSTTSVDPTRPLVEFYRRHDEIELWVPVAS
jgi:hypothetical protein